METSGINKFEDLKCWQLARGLVNMVYQLTKEGNFSKDFGLRDQVRRAAVSVMANIAEGFGAHSNVEFARFLKIATRSCLEVQSHLYVALDNDLINQDVFKKTYEKTQNCTNMVRGFIRYLRSEGKNEA
ncbi:MAG: four helix bundle protein [Deltaproteobacteria bacterium RIFCSPLOWO2_12_FULL_44_12]|nr:MAG: four helix bundle protein [Deltaproteobacteria bacterium RIFCSPHIGHO2_01_FULL_43_49]OGQ14254.1 MAG: four helix bundle protein [Deltaproteobacteria bacterium RIFCSPHIGHO2_02_FULL_44_53]OGQ27470.1 MAG: four helix bundle protein [Deltaproteobacteria bacterium RIFCSPHIGHO2_12_FULL_44_21]OGQ30718.1 MAG: four helix bundle protein [Deltaproteobacteria bacterium RIFCSPLOWO2_01_FULL_45_74]OGQ42395.1 MAG: four helix bundle protein [Deltaproteobacteria bacterium RIFCSPLOWO2_02_FULL_44_34]OGQ69185